MALGHLRLDRVPAGWRGQASLDWQKEKCKPVNHDIRVCLRVKVALAVKRGSDAIEGVKRGKAFRRLDISENACPLAGFLELRVRDCRCNLLDC